jgi:hypothetical protein
MTHERNGEGIWRKQWQGMKEWKKTGIKDKWNDNRMNKI